MAAFRSIASPRLADCSSLAETLRNLRQSVIWGDMRKILVLGALAALLCGSAPALADDWAVVKLRGTVQQLVEGAWTPVGRGDRIPDERAVRTLGDGYADLQRGAEVVTLGADTQVVIHDRQDVRYTVVQQEFGSVEVEAQVENVQHFAVETRFLAAVVKGTHFTVTASALGASVAVARGQVEVESVASKRKTTVTIGQVASVTPGVDMVLSGGGSMPAIFGPDGRIVQPAGAPAGTAPAIATPKAANRNPPSAGEAIVTTAALVNPADAGLVVPELRGSLDTNWARVLEQSGGTVTAREQPINNFTIFVGALLGAAIGALALLFRRYWH
jgi:hypothetical protein